MLKFLCLALFVGLTSAELKFIDCGNKEIKSLKVTGCDTAPCALHKGKDAEIDITFTANEDSKAVITTTKAKIGELEVEIPGIDIDACDGHVKCPLKNGETYTVVYKISIPAQAPSVEADVTAVLKGDGGKVLACGQIHGSIKD